MIFMGSLFFFWVGGEGGGGGGVVVGNKQNLRASYPEGAKLN